MAIKGFAHLDENNLVVEAGAPSTFLAPSGEVILASVADVDLKATGDTVLYTVPAGYSVLVTDICQEVTTISGYVSRPSGTTGQSSAYSDFGTLGNDDSIWNSLGRVVSSITSIPLKFRVYQSGEVIGMKVTSGANATTLVATAYVLGYLIENEPTTSYAGVTLLSTVPVNLKNTGQTTLYTVPSNRSLIIIDVIPKVTLADTVVVGPTLTVGKSGALTDWLVSTAVSSALLSTAGLSTSLANSALSLSHKFFSAGDIIQVDITTGATATSLTADFNVIGILI